MVSFVSVGIGPETESAKGRGTRRRNALSDETITWIDCSENLSNM